MTRLIRTLSIVLVALFGLGLPAGSVAAQSELFPTSISLPSGWRPEGIALGYGTTVYSGSTETGAIYQADIRTGQGSILVPPVTGNMAVGIHFDPRTHLLYTAGGITGKVYVHDTSTGVTVATITATTDAMTFVNDVVVTRDAVYFTDSYRPFLYRLPLLAQGRLPLNPVAEEVPLSGDYSMVAGGAFNANGIVAVPGTQQLVIVNSALGTLYLVDSATGISSLIDLKGGNVLNGDGLLLEGHELYVVQNYNGQIAVVDLDWCRGSGHIERTIVDSRFDFPTTLVDFGPSLYVINSRLSTPPTPDMAYSILRVSKRK
jgi:DNA-binding beta-propeller fold protein YncE